MVRKSGNMFGQTCMVDFPNDLSAGNKFNFEAKLVDR